MLLIKHFSIQKLRRILTHRNLLGIGTAIIAAYEVLTQGQKGEIRTFYSAQAYSMLSGDFNVSSSSLPGECYVSNNKCFGYFGITPSLLRIPLLILFPNKNFTSVALIVAISIGIFLSFLVADQIINILKDNSRVIRENCGKRIQIMIYYLIGPGSLFLQLTRPSGQWEAIAWSATFCLAGISLILGWSIKRRKIYLIFSILFFTLGANSRITIAVFALTFILSLSLISHKSFSQFDRIEKSALTVMGILPIVTSLFILWLKFGTVFPNLTLHEQVPEAAHWAKILEVNGGKTVGLGFIPTNLLTYFRPDSMVFQKSWELVSLRPNFFPVQSIPPIRAGGMYNEPTVSMTNIVPIAYMMVFYFFRQICSIFRSPLKAIKHVSSLSRELQILWCLSFASLTQLLITFTFVTSSNRYLGDFIPLVVVIGTIASVLMIVQLFSTGRNRILNSRIASFLIAAGVIANLLTSYTRAKYNSL